MARGDYGQRVRTGATMTAYRHVVTASRHGSKAKTGASMSGSGFDRFVEQYHAALDEFVRGNAAAMKELWSRRDDVTLANPLGPPARGWKAVEKIMERAASQLSEGEPNQFERLSGHAEAGLAYIVEIERTRMKVGGSDEMSPVSLRATTVFRPEDGLWKVLHRHADPITTPRPIESIIQK